MSHDAGWLSPDDMRQLQALGYKGGLRITYEEVRTGDLVQTVGKYRDLWTFREISHVHSFSNFSHDFESKPLAWLMTGSGVGCPLIVLERNPHGLPPCKTKHMPSPGLGFEHGVAQKSYQYRCNDAACVCYQNIECKPKPISGLWPAQFR